jgi:Ni2+-binding GTPase involved in maturation of urease and hydrogenase
VKKIIKDQTFSKSIKMLSVDRKHLSFKHPFTCITAGPTSSGKTVLIRGILKHHKSLIFFKKGSIDILKVI